MGIWSGEKKGAHPDAEKRGIRRAPSQLRLWTNSSPFLKGGGNEIQKKNRTEGEKNCSAKPGHPQRVRNSTWVSSLNPRSTVL